jgi:hypothetical protein
MAGREAELECLGASRGNDGDRFDFDDINELMPKIYPKASRAELSHRRDQLRRMTRALVRRHRDKIERVACALLRRRTLSWRAIGSSRCTTWWRGRRTCTGDRAPRSATRGCRRIPGQPPK